MTRLLATLLSIAVLHISAAPLRGQSRLASLRSGDIVRIWTSDSGKGPQLEGMFNTSSDTKVELTDPSGTQWAIPMNTLKRLDVQTAPIRSVTNVPRYALGGATVGVMAQFFWQVTQVGKAYRHGYSNAPTGRYVTAAALGATVGAVYGAIRPHSHWMPVIPQ